MQRRRRGATRLAVALSCVVATAAQAHETPDLSRYVELLERVELAQEALRDAPEDVRPQHRALTITAHAELLVWLEAFIGSEAYTDLDAEAHALVQRDVDTSGVSIARLQAEGGACAVAFEALDAALARTDSDERRRFVQGAGADLEPCPAQSWIVLEVDPTSARAELDDHPLGPADGRYRVAAGRYALRLSAPEHEGVDLEVDAEPGEELIIGPLALLPVGESRGVEPHVWTLWTVGVAGVGVGVGYLLFAESRRAELDELEARGAVIVDRDDEVATNRRLRRVGGATLGVGLLAATLGTVLHVTRDSGGGEGASRFDLEGGADGFGMRWSVTF